MAEMYSVWVGSVEVNDYYLSFLQAVEVADYWLAQDYDDVFIELLQEDN